ncbi:hypothetical protein [Microbacterium sp. LWH10-1.2]|uniref:hypothetical protein n=1 Tax=Microbacterium sp. LWH10-1.2 TaxID=3135255 RepID=UPI003138E30E
MFHTMTRRRENVGFLLVCTAVVSLVGCAPTEVPGYLGEPTTAGQPLPVNVDEGAEVQAWWAGETLIVTTVGSGSCPVVPVIADVDEDKQTITLTTEILNSSGACTADSTPRTFELDAGRDLDGFTVQVTTG